MKCPECGRDFSGIRGVKIHMTAKTSVCKNQRLEAELGEKMKAEPENPEVMMKLITLLQCDGPPRGRIQEAYKLCLKRQRDWRWSANWQLAILELCQNYQDQFKSGRQCGPEFYSLQLASLDRLLDFKTRSGSVTTELTQLTDLLVRMERSLELLESSGAPPSLVSHWRGQLLSNYAMTVLESSLEDNREMAGKLYLAAWLEEVSPDWREEGEMRRVVAGHRARELAGEAGRKRSVRETVADLVSSLYTPDQGEKRPELSWTEPKKERPLPSITEIASQAGGYLSLYKEDLDSLVWLLVRHRGHLSQRDLVLHLLSVGRDLDLDMIAFLLATLVSLEEGGKVTEEQRRWWRLAARAERFQLTSQDKIILQHGLDIIRCSGVHGLQPGLTMKLGATFLTGGESEEVRARAELYYRATLDTIAFLERGGSMRQPSVPLWSSPHTLLNASQMKEMKALARQVLGVKEAEENQETQVTNNMITPVSIATTATQTETEVFNSNIAATQTEAEEVNVRALLDKTEERLGEHINQVSSGILAQLMPLLHNIQQQINDLRQDSLSLITPAQSVPLSPERPEPCHQLSQVSVTLEKHGHHGSHTLLSEQEEIPACEVEKEDIEEIDENLNDSIDTTNEENIVDQVNDSGVGSEKELENNNIASHSELEEKKGRKREAGKDLERELKSRPKKKKNISREVEEEEELKPGEEKVIHRQKARLSVKDDVEWEERGQGEVKVIKDLRSGQVRLELRGAQYGEVCLSQLVSPEVLASFSRSAASAWSWRDPRMREQFQLTLDTELDCEGFKRALDESAGNKSLFGFFHKILYWK